MDSASSAWCSDSRPGGTGTTPVRIFSGVASLPYAFSLAAVCALTLAPVWQPRCHGSASLPVVSLKRQSKSMLGSMLLRC